LILICKISKDEIPKDIPHALHSMEATDPTSRPIRSLGCPTLHFLTSFLLTDTDLVGIGCWDAEMHSGLTPTAWCRSLLHVAIQQREDAARRVTDLLDLRHLEEVVDVRAALPSELACRATDAVDGQGNARGLVWALVTDPRDEVHSIGLQTITEIYVRACRDYGARSSA
jgi:hypothetical protein